MTSDRQHDEHLHDEHRHRPPVPRWTHIALRVDDIDASIAWYETHTPLELIERRSDADGHGAWLGHREQGEHPFILVLAEFFPESRPFGALPKAVLGPFAHLGIELPSAADVDAVAERAAADGCLVMAPERLPDPIGYICMVADPDGNLIEFSFDQGVYARVIDRQKATDAPEQQ
jgi:catechol 2,3-dioxygenase-like lactoylglutathione lyase family enzyme